MDRLSHLARLRLIELSAVVLLGLGFVYYPVLLPVRFTRERIEIRIEAPGRVHVTARYELTNLSPLPIQLPFDYPVPHDRPGEAWVTDVRDDTGPVAWAPSGSGATYVLRWRGREIKWLVVEYDQSAPGREARYILTTTRLWKLPIRESEFVITSTAFPFTVTLPGESPRTCDAKCGTLDLVRTNYFPAADLWLKW